MEEAEAGSTTSGSTASSPAPAAAPAPVAAPAASAPVASNVSAEESPDIDWEKESDLGDENEVQHPPKAASAAAPAAAKAAPVATPAAAAPAVTAPAAAAPVAQPAAAPVAAPAAAPAKPAVAAAETPEAKTAREAAEKVEDEKQFKGLMEYYKLPEDLVAKLQTEPENVLPHLAATLHRTIARGVVNLLQSQLPSYLHHHGEVTRANDEAKNEFYSANPHLKGYEQQVLQAGAMYRQLNPTADRVTSIKAIGKIVTDSLGLTPGAPAAAPAAAAVAAAATAAAGYQPAGAGGSRGPAPAGDSNEFTQMSLEDD